MNYKNSIKALYLLLAVILFNSCQENRNINHSFCHHVYFWLNNPDNPADRDSFEKGIAELLKIPEIKSYHFGIPANTGNRDVVDGSYTYSYMVFFDNENGHDVYQDHPIHLKFVDDCKHLWNKVVVYDSVLK
jgi:hypothetical protein